MNSADEISSAYVFSKLCFYLLMLVIYGPCYAFSQNGWVRRVQGGGWSSARDLLELASELHRQNRRLMVFVAAIGP
jgi:hypothetical protein